ncbi:MAG: A24 family peptidase [Acidobacteriota bacterium]|nr:A24 family peptidase [Acidobacteriota bacterium]
MSIPITVVLLLVVVAAGIYDLRVRRIPNWLNLSGLILGLGFNAMPGQDGVAKSLVGLACALAVYIPLYLVRGMGAGDVKLMAAVGSITGPANWLGIFIVTAILGGIAALVLIAVRRKFQQTVLNLGTILRELFHRRMPSAADEKLDIRDSRALRMPHGAIIAAGSILFLLLRSN